jgi:hypothetical protein
MDAGIESGHDEKKALDSGLPAFAEAKPCSGCGRVGGRFGFAQAGARE